MPEILFVNAAIQNRGFNLDESPGKIAGIRLATVLNRLNGNEEIFHAWNNVGSFHQQEPLSPSERIEQKYASETMENYMDFWELDASKIQVMRDDDEQFVRWSLDKLTDLLDSGVVTIEEALFDACIVCDAVVAESVAGATNCTNCGSGDLCSKKEDALFVSIPEDRFRLLDDRFVYNSMNLRNEIDSLKQVPPRLLLSRDRNIGVQLDGLNLEGKKLDPRLGIGLLAIYAAVISDYETVAMTQTTSTLIRTAPYIGSVLLKTSAERRLLYVPHTRIDTNVHQQADVVGLQVVAPFAAAQRNQQVNSQRYQQASKEFMKFARNIEALQVIFKRLGLDSDTQIPILRPDPQGLTNTISDMGKKSGRIIEELKRKGQSDPLSSEVVSSADELIATAKALKLVCN